jgi:hypothetical protein
MATQITSPLGTWCSGGDGDVGLAPTKLAADRSESIRALVSSHRNFDRPLMAILPVASSWHMRSKRRRRFVHGPIEPIAHIEPIIIIIIIIIILFVLKVQHKQYEIYKLISAYMID